MSAQPLVLSIFPGLDLLGAAFELEGYCVVRGPDVLWGGDIHSFSPPAGVFAGVIGGPPCQTFSRLAHMVRHNGYEPKFGNLIPEFERVVVEAQPAWFLMENVPAAPAAEVPGYMVHEQVVNNRWFVDDDGLGAAQQRKRRLSFGTRDGRRLAWDVALWESPVRRQDRLSDPSATPIKLGGSGQVKATFAVTARHAARVPWVPSSVTAGHGGASSKQYVYSLEDACELQGLPRDFCAHMPFTKQAKLQAVANGVPIPTGRAIARAILRALVGVEAADAS